jgi:hypothetical protein
MPARCRGGGSDEVQPVWRFDLDGLDAGLIEPVLEGGSAIGTEIAGICGLMNVGKDEAEPVLRLGMEMIDGCGSAAAIAGLTEKAGGCHERVLSS